MNTRRAGPPAVIGTPSRRSTHLNSLVLDEACFDVRILTYLHSFEPGGVERVALRLVRHWRNVGVDAALYLGRPTGAMAKDIGGGLTFVSPRQPPFGTAWIETLWMIMTLPRTIRALRPDVLFCVGNTYSIVAVAMRLLLGRGCPPIVAKISNDLSRTDWPAWKRLPYHLWLRVQGPLFAHVIGLEANMAAEIRERLGIPPERITIIPSPVLSQDVLDRLRSARCNQPRHRVGRRFVGVGRLTGQKNFALMLRAFQRGAEAADTLTIIGDGALRSQLERLAERLGISERVSFRGYTADPTEILTDFDILILSSDYEGVPAVIIEALAANLHVIATDCSRSIVSLLADGALGTVVPVGDELRMAAAIRSALAGKQDATLSLAQAERFTLEHASEVYLRLFETLAPRHRMRAQADAKASRSSLFVSSPKVHLHQRHGSASHDGYTATERTDVASALSKP